MKNTDNDLPGVFPSGTGRTSGMIKHNLAFEYFVNKNYTSRLKGTYTIDGNKEAISFIIFETVTCFDLSFDLYETQAIIKHKVIQEYGENWYTDNAEAINFIIENEYADFGDRPTPNVCTFSKEQFADYVKRKELFLNQCPSCNGKATIIGIHTKLKEGAIIDSVGCEKCNLFVERELKLLSNPYKLFSKRTKSVVDVMKVWNSLTKQES